MEIQRISSKDYVSAWNLGGLVVTQMALKAAIELNVFNIIANSGPGAHLTSKEIVSQISNKNPNAAAANLKRILRVLSVHSLLSVSQRSSSSGGETMLEETYGLTKETLCLVPNKDGVSLAPYIMLVSEMHSVKCYSILKDTVLEPGSLPYKKAHGMSLYEHMSDKPELTNLFNEAIGQTTSINFEDVLKVYKGFEEVKELMDVGGGNGTTIAKVVSSYPHIHGINFDLPNVIAQATAKYQAGVKYVGGDMLELIPNAESIMLKILKILEHGSIRGLSILSFELELVGYTIALAYCLHGGLPFSAYGELAFLLIQALILVAIMYYYSQPVSIKRWMTALLYCGIAPTILAGRIDPVLVEALYASQHAIFLFAKIPQIWQNFSNKSTGELSFLTNFMNFGGSMVRVFTSIQEQVQKVIVLACTVADWREPFSLPRGWLLWAGIGLVGAVVAVALTGAATSFFSGQTPEREIKAFGMILRMGHCYTYL